MSVAMLTQGRCSMLGFGSRSLDFPLSRLPAGSKLFVWIDSRLMHLFGPAGLTAELVGNSGSQSFGSPRSLADDVVRRRQRQDQLQKKKGSFSGTTATTPAALRRWLQRRTGVAGAPESAQRKKWRRQNRQSYCQPRQRKSFTLSAPRMCWSTSCVRGSLSLQVLG